MPTQNKREIEIIQDSIISISDFMKAIGMHEGDKLSDYVDIIKTIAHYRRVLNRAVLDFYRGDIDAFGFIDKMIQTIDSQFRAAWREGMRNVNLDPAEDMIPLWADILEQRIQNEYNHILQFAEDIDKARENEEPVKPLQARIDLWTNRYSEIVNLAMTTCGGKVKLEWQLGRTERHCSTCSALNGTVAYSEEWQAAGLQPQAAPNPRLECGGWRCDCRLVPTDKRRTRGGIPNV